MEVTRKIDDLGRLVIPKELRAVLDWNERDAIAMRLHGNTGLMLEKSLPSCFVCGEVERLVKIGSANVCAGCREKLRDAQDGDTIEVETKDTVAE